MEDIVDCCVSSGWVVATVVSERVRELQMVAVVAVRDYYELQPSSHPIKPGLSSVTGLLKCIAPRHQANEAEKLTPRVR